MHDQWRAWPTVCWTLELQCPSELFQIGQRWPDLDASSSVTDMVYPAKGTTEGKAALCGGLSKVLPDNRHSLKGHPGSTTQGPPLLYPFPQGLPMLLGIKPKSLSFFSWLHLFPLFPLLTPRSHISHLLSFLCISISFLPPVQFCFSTCHFFHLQGSSPRWLRGSGAWTLFKSLLKFHFIRGAFSYWPIANSILSFHFVPLFHSVFLFST